MYYFVAFSSTLVLSAGHRWEPGWQVVPTVSRSVVLGPLTRTGTPRRWVQGPNYGWSWFLLDSKQGSTEELSLYVSMSKALKRKYSRNHDYNGSRALWNDKSRGGSRAPGTNMENIFLSTEQVRDWLSETTDLNSMIFFLSFLWL